MCSPRINLWEYDDKVKIKSRQKKHDMKASVFCGKFKWNLEGMKMRTVYNKEEFLKALKDRCSEIKIINSYANEVFRKYSRILNTPPIPLGVAVALIPKVGISGYLEYYKIKSYKEDELIIIRN